MEVEKKHDRNNPFLAKLVERCALNKEGSLKDIRHLVVNLSGSGLSYSCGDSLGVFPENDAEEVGALLRALGFDGEEKVCLPKLSEELSIREALLTKLSIRQPSRRVLKAYYETVTHLDERARLEKLLRPECTEECKQYAEQRSFLDLAEEYPSAKFAPQAYVDGLCRLVPRLYSIASSSLLYPDEVHLTVVVVRYQGARRMIQGVASSYLAERVVLDQSVLPVFVARSHFKLPQDDSADLIMVGPGTGVAPFRAFVQERCQKQAKGRMWLFFGDQRKAYDYLYEEEWQKYLSEGQLTRLDLAFSRDQEYKIYVQDRMLENAAALWKWLEGGAYLYVCGDAKRMAKDVDAALHRIVQEQGQMSEEKTKEYVKMLKKQKRYQRDIY